MHLLREGEFSVASTFIQEASQHPPQPEPTANTPNPYQNLSWEKNMADGTFNSETLQKQFLEMYHILHELRQERNLGPAIEWARERSDSLEARGSNLEFELCRLQFVCLFVGHGVNQDEDERMEEAPLGPMEAWAYARREFAGFQRRYAREVQQLMGAMAYWQNVVDSPYRRYFYNDAAWEDVATSFTREFCSLLGLSADSPLYIAATAGAIALPHLLKLQSIMEKTRTEWTTQNELPVSRLILISHLSTSPVHPSSHVNYTFASTSLTQIGRNPTPTTLPLPLHLRLPRVQRAIHRREPAHDDALWTCHSARVVRQTEQGNAVQVSVLPRGEPSERCREGVLVVHREPDV